MELINNVGCKSVEPDKGYIVSNLENAAVQTIPLARIRQFGKRLINNIQSKPKKLFELKKPISIKPVGNKVIPVDTTLKEFCISDSEHTMTKIDFFDMKIEGKVVKKNIRKTFLDGNKIPSTFDNDEFKFTMFTVEKQGVDMKLNSDLQQKTYSDQFVIIEETKQEHTFKEDIDPKHNKLNDEEKMVHDFSFTLTNNDSCYKTASKDFYRTERVEDQNLIGRNKHPLNAFEEYKISTEKTHRNKSPMLKESVSMADRKGEQVSGLYIGEWRKRKLKEKTRKRKANKLNAAT